MEFKTPGPELSRTVDIQTQFMVARRKIYGHRACRRSHISHAQPQTPLSSIGAGFLTFLKRKIYLDGFQPTLNSSIGFVSPEIESSNNHHLHPFSVLRFEPVLLIAATAAELTES